MTRLKLISRIALLVWALAHLCFACFGQDRPAGAPFYFHQITSANGGTFTNADVAPTWTLLRNGNTVVTTGTFTVCGTGTLAGDYYGSLTLNGASFNTNDSYAIEATGTISAVPVKSIVAEGLVLPAQNVAGYQLVDAAKAGGQSLIATGSISLDDLYWPVAGSAIHRGTAQGGAVGFITLDSGASAVNTTYVFDWVYITAGTGAGQFDHIITYVGNTRTATVQNGFNPAPDNTSQFIVFAAPKVNTYQITGIYMSNGRVLPGGGTLDSVSNVTNRVTAGGGTLDNVGSVNTMAANSIGSLSLSGNALGSQTVQGVTNPVTVKGAHP